MTLKAYHNGEWHHLSGNKVYHDGSWIELKPQDRFYRRGHWYYMRNDGWFIAGHPATDEVPLGISAGGFTWHRRLYPYTYAHALCYNGERWLSSSLNKIVELFDGSQINPTPSLNGYLELADLSGEIEIINNIAWNGFIWVAVGRCINSGSHSIMTSTDGSTWTGRGEPFGGEAAYGVAWNGSMFVATGGVIGGSSPNTIATSPDGITWTARGNPFPNDWGGRGVAWNGSIWIVVGAGIFTSPDGITWTDRNCGGGMFYDVAWNGSIFVAGGDEKIYTSPDGINWTYRGSPLGSSGIVVSVSWNGSIFLAAGYGTTKLAYSSDGITWGGVYVGWLDHANTIASSTAPNLYPPIT